MFDAERDHKKLMGRPAQYKHVGVLPVHHKAPMFVDTMVTV